MAYTFDWGAVVTGQYGHWLVQGFVTTMEISGLSIAISLAMGMTIAVLRISRVRLLEGSAMWFTEFFRNTPLLVQMFFWYFGSSAILPEAVNKWLYRQDFEFTAGTIALSVYTAAFIAEDIRSGIFAIPKNQLEASRACGLSFLQAQWYVILPQAFRIIVPPLISQFLNLIKNSSLVMTIGVMDLTYMARQVESYSFHGFEAFTVSTLMYLAVSLVLSAAIQIYSHRSKTPVRA